jgi:uncharacterized Zn finger protein
MGASVNCPACSRQTRYDSSEIIERGGLWVVKCECGNVVSIRKVKSIEEQIREATEKQ